MFPPIADKKRVHLWQHLERFFSSLLSYKEFWAAIIGAVIGGLFAVFAQFLSTLWQRKSERDAERRAINGTLRAMKTELESFQKAFVKGTDEVLKKWEEQYKKQVPLNLPPIAQNYFIVFDASAAALGGIENDDLRQRILGTIYQAKILIEAINTHHQRYQVYEPLAHKPGTPEMHALKDDLFQWADVIIRSRLEPLQKKVPGLLDDIQKYLDR